MSIMKPISPISPSLSWLSATELLAVKGYIERIRSLYGELIQQIILFGSRVRGEGNEESDIDIAIIITMEDPLLRRRLYDIATEQWLESDIKISPLVFSIEEFQQYLKMRRGIAITILDEGIPL